MSTGNLSTGTPGYRLKVLIACDSSSSFLVLKLLCASAGRDSCTFQSQLIRFPTAAHDWCSLSSRWGHTLKRTGLLKESKQCRRATARAPWVHFMNWASRREDAHQVTWHAAGPARRPEGGPALCTSFLYQDFMRLQVLMLSVFRHMS